MLKNVFRKTLSVVVALIMVFTTFCIAVPFTASAAVSAASASNAGNVYFVVPEAIYLKPTWNSYYTNAQMPFQWYVNNTLTSSNTITLDTGEDKVGDIYFYYAGATKADVSFEWLDAAGRATSGGSVKFGDSNERYAGTAYTMNSSRTAIHITAGTSPSMSAATTGAYLRWTASFTDTTDNRVKTVSAYTYVYKPYVQPVGTAIKTVNDRGSNHYGQNLAWISGVHDTDSSALGSHYPNTSATSDGNGLLVISSSDSSGTAVGKVGGLYAQIPDRFKTTASNQSSAGWLNQISSPLYVPDKSFRYLCNDLTGHSSGDDAFHSLCYSPTAFMTIDVSRYTNLNQIPNISLGIMVTDDEDSSDGGAWFVANYTGTPTEGDDRDYFKNNTSPAQAIWDRYSANHDIAENGTYSAPAAGDEAEGVKYNGKWPKALSTSAGTSTYYVGAGYFNHDGSGSHYGGDTIWNVSELRMKVTRYNKATLRTAVQHAINAAATLNTAFYDRTNAIWVNYTNLFHAASLSLTKLDGTFSVQAVVNGSTVTYTNPSTLATALTSAVDSLLSGTGRVENRKATQSNIALQDRGDGTYAYAQLLGGTATRTATFTTYQTVTFTADSIPGYTFVGLLQTQNVPTVVVGSSANYPSSFTSSATGATFSGSTVKYTHTDVTGTDGNGNLYYSYYYVANRYTVHYNPNGGTGSMADQQFTYNVAQNLFENTFTRNGYTFAGWATSATGSKAYNDGQSVNNLTTSANGTVNLYALWTAETYDILYDTVGGAIEGSPMEHYNINTAVTLPNATRVGHSLVNWRADGSGNWGPMTYSAGVPINGKYGTVKFTAVWKANNYSVAFNKNGGSGTDMANQSFVYGVSQDLTACAYSRTGYVFRGWATTNTASDPVYADKETVQNLTSENGAVVTLYAIWGTTSYSIVYDVVGGSIRDADYTRNYTTLDSVQLPTVVEKTGYVFGGWKPANSVGTWNADSVYNNTLNSGMIGNVTLKAQWTVQGYTIHYELDGGRFVNNNYTTAYNITTSITLPSASKSGYTFGNWRADGVGNWGDSTYAAGAVSAGRYGDVTLTAQWTGIQYYVAFNGNNSTGGVMYNQSFTYGVKAPLNQNEFTRSGYTFLGWATSGSATRPQYQDREEVQNLSTQPSGVLTLFAVWEKNGYRISYDANGGTIATQGTVDYAITDPINLSTVTRVGYAFGGWRPTENVGTWYTWNVYTGALEAGNWGSVSLKAEWTKETYTIEYDAVGGTLSGNYTTTYDVDTTIVLATVERAGYAFSGWQATAAWNNVLITDNQAPAGAMGNVILTALWRQQTYYIKFNANGGTGTMENQLMRFDESQALTPNAFTRDGYNFSGWATSATGTFAYADGDIVRNLTQMDGGIVNLYAVWNSRNFSITYNLNGASGTLIPTNVVMDGATVTLRNYNVPDSVLINGVPCTFAGWAYNLEEAAAGTASYANKAPFSLNAEVLERADVDWTPDKPVITLYAVWIESSIKLIPHEDSTTVIDADRRYIYGLKGDITKDELENEYLAIQGNGRLVIRGDGAVGTGTIVDLISNHTNEVLETYEIVIFGDVNGDGMINSSDVTKIRMMNAELETTSFNSVYGFAADIYADGDINTTDVTTLRMVASNLRTYDQATRTLLDD